MRKIAFDEEELLVLAVLEPDTRKNTIARLEEILPEVKDDPDMEAIVISATCSAWRSIGKSCRQRMKKVRRNE